MYFFMNDLWASIIIIILLIMIISKFFTKWNKLVKITVSFLLMCVLISIPVIGHSEWNRETRLIHELNNLKMNSLSPFSDIEAVNEIIHTKHPLEIRHISSNRELFEGGTLFSNEVVVINYKKYNIRLACYLTPLPFTPYETWKINNVKRTN